MIGRIGIAVRAQDSAPAHIASPARRMPLAAGQRQRVVHVIRPLGAAAVWAGSLFAASALLQAIGALAPGTAGQPAEAAAADLLVSPAALLSGTALLTLSVGLFLLAFAAAGPRRARLASIVGGIAALPPALIGATALLASPLGATTLVGTAGAVWAPLELAALLPLAVLCATASAAWTAAVVLVAANTTFGVAAIGFLLGTAEGVAPGAVAWTGLTTAALTTVAALLVWVGRHRAR